MRALLPILLLSACAPPPEALVTVPPVAASQAQLQMVHRVVDGLSGLPLSGVDVEVIGTTYRTRTDQAGRAEIPLYPHHHWLRVSANGYGANHTRRGTVTRLWPNQVADEAIQRYLRDRNRPSMDSDDLSDPDLTEVARRFISRRQAGVHHLDEGIPLPQLKQGLIPPETIRIYRRGPENNSCQGRVDVIPLEDYVKGVVPHEWIASWHDESLRAGSIAARGYAWGWILRGGKYDCADLDDTTRSQVYREDRTERANQATDSTAGVGIIRDGMLVASEYSAENGDPTEFGVSEPLCTGREVFGHGRGMCQWGTQRWATQRGQTAEWMVEHYYPGATTTRGGSVGGPQVTLSQGLMRVEAVRCVDPEGMYGCADFVNQAWSVGIFDLFLQQRVVFSVEVTNEGEAEALGVEVAVRVPTPFLSVAEIDTAGETTELNGSTYQIRFARIPTGSSQVIRLTLRGSEANLSSEQPAPVHTWVKTIDGVYEKADWNQAPTLNEGQSFNGGDLLALSEFDVFDPRHWTWSTANAAMLEGWIPQASAAASASPAGLRLGDGRTLIDSPLLPNTPDEIRSVTLEYDGMNPIRLWWRGSEEGFESSRAIFLESGTHPVEPSDWSGLEQLRLEVTGPATIRRLRLNRQLAPRLDAGPPVSDAQLDAEDGGSGPDRPPVDASSSEQSDAHADERDAVARRPVRVRFVGGQMDGCVASASSDGADAILWFVLAAWGFRRRIHGAS